MIDFIAQDGEGYGALVQDGETIAGLVFIGAVVLLLALYGLRRKK